MPTSTPRTVIVTLALVLAWCAITGVPAAAQDPEEEVDAPFARRVKSAYLFNFLSYVEWPARAFADSASPLVVGVLGTDEAVAEVKEMVAERLVDGRAVVVRRLRDGDALSGVHLLYVTRPETARTSALAPAARASATLVVTEAENALDLGSAINFRLVGGRVRFDVALAPIEQAGLRVSSRLLAVAQTVRGGP